MRPSRFLLLACVASLIFLQGCVVLQLRHPLPEHLQDQVQVENLPGIRAWGDTYSENLEQSAIESIRQELADNHGKLAPEADYLALSGGGGDGCGAGIYVAGPRQAPGHNLNW